MFKEKHNVLILTVVVVGVAAGLWWLYNHQKLANTPTANASASTPATAAKTT